MVLGGGAQQRRAADVDVLDGGFQVAAGFGHGLLEGIEVDDYQVDGLDAILPHHRVVKAAATQDTAMDEGVEGLDPPRHHLREAGVVGDLGDRDSLFRQQAGGAAGGQDSIPRAARARAKSIRPVLSETLMRARRMGCIWVRSSRSQKTLGAGE